MLGDAPVWYSKAEQVAREKLGGSASGDSILATLRNAGVKAQEMEWLGLEEKLKGKPKVSKDEVLQMIRENGVELQETMLEKPSSPFLPADRGPKYEQYTLPGEKENYKEMLLQLPERGGPEGTTPADVEWIRQQRQAGIDDDAIDRGLTQRRQRREAVNFQSGHFTEHPNILAHVRFDDRITADGKRTLFVEEVQSDWHQKGKREGYKTVSAKDAARAVDLANEKLRSAEERLRIAKTYQEESIPKAEADYEAARLAVGEAMEAYNASQSGVPDAPFKSDWHELAVKRMLRYAAEHGYDSISWVTGEQTAERYDLSKQISRIDWFPTSETPSDHGRLIAYNPDGAQVIDKQIYANDLPNYIGKEPARKLLGEEGAPKVPKLTYEQAQAEILKTVKDEYKDYQSEYPLDYDKKMREAEKNPYEFISWRGFEETAKRLSMDPHTLEDIIEGRVRPASEGIRSIRGLDLKVGGEWAKNLYDRAIPNFVNKFARRWGTKAGETELKPLDYGEVEVDYVGPELSASELRKRWDAGEFKGTVHEGQVRSIIIDMEQSGYPFRDSILRDGSEALAEDLGGRFVQNRKKVDGPRVHTLPITPEMRRSIMKEGVPIAKKDDDQQSIIGRQLESIAV